MSRLTDTRRSTARRLRIPTPASTTITRAAVRKIFEASRTPLPPQVPTATADERARQRRGDMIGNFRELLNGSRVPRGCYRERVRGRVAEDVLARESECWGVARKGFHGSRVYKFA